MAKKKDVELPQDDPEVVEEDKRFSFNKEGGKKILVGAGIALGGALLTYLAELIPNVDFGSYTPVVVGLASILINAGRKFLQGVK